MLWPYKRKKKLHNQIKGKEKNKNNKREKTGGAFKLP